MDTNDRLRAFLATVQRRWFADEGMSVVALGSAAAALPGLMGLRVRADSAGRSARSSCLRCDRRRRCRTAIAVGIRMHPQPTDRQVARFVEERAAALPGVQPFDDAMVTAVDSSVAARSGLSPAAHGGSSATA